MGIFLPAWKNKDEKKRSKWLERTANPRKSKHREIIAHLALTDNSTQVRYASLFRIRDKTLLLHVATHDSEYFVRQLAYRLLWKQDSPEALADTAINDSYYINRQKAYIGLGQENCLEALLDVISNDPSEQDRQAAAEKITDQDTLAKIARNSNSYTIRKIAIGKISDLVELGECLALEERQKVSEWYATPLPRGIASQIVDAWFRSHEGQQVRITFLSIVDGITYRDMKLWTIVPPISFDPLIWELPVINGFYDDAPCELLCLSFSEDVALVNVATPYREKRYIPAHHEAETSSERLLYKVAFSSSSYKSGNDYISFSGPTVNCEHVKLWQYYIFELLVG